MRFKNCPSNGLLIAYDTEMAIKCLLTVTVRLIVRLMGKCNAKSNCVMH